MENQDETLTTGEKVPQPLQPKPLVAADRPLDDTVPLGQRQVPKAAVLVASMPPLTARPSSAPTFVAVSGRPGVASLVRGDQPRRNGKPVGVSPPGLPVTFDQLPQIPEVELVEVRRGIRSGHQAKWVAERLNLIGLSLVAYAAGENEPGAGCRVLVEKCHDAARGVVGSLCAALERVWKYRR
jgi:hypothetical protein